MLRLGNTILRQTLLLPRLHQAGIIQRTVTDRKANTSGIDTETKHPGFGYVKLRCACNFTEPAALALPLNTDYVLGHASG
jgi:hypothetical protein